MSGLTEDPDTWVRAVRWSARKHAGMLYYVSGDADDLEQELWIALLHEQKQGRIPHLVSHPALFFHFLHLRAIDYVRDQTFKRSRARVAAGHVILVDTIAKASILPHVKPAWGRGMHTEPDDWADLAGTLAFFDNLSERDRHIVRRRFAGESLKEIAAGLGVTESRICQRFAELRRKFRTWEEAA